MITRNHSLNSIIILMLGTTILLSPACAGDDKNDIRQPVSASESSISENQSMETGDGANPSKGPNEVLPSSDYLYPNNTRMINPFGGELTQYDWYIRRARATHRVIIMKRGLFHYFSLYGMYPISWEEFDKSKFFPIRPLDPISGSPINYDSPPQSEDDFDNLAIQIERHSWSFHGMSPDRNGNWFEDDYTFEEPGDIAQGVIDHNRSDLGANSNALKGLVLAESLLDMLMDYELRRREFPRTSEDLLDGLWYVHDDWATSDMSLDHTQPGGFLFGVDEKLSSAIAIWRDAAGIPHARCWKWSTWPIGWGDEPYTPTLTPGAHGMPRPFSDYDFVPSRVLWKCSIL